MRQQLNQELIILQQKYVGINIQLIKKSWKGLFRNPIKIFSEISMSIWSNISKINIKIQNFMKLSMIQGKFYLYILLIQIAYQGRGVEISGKTTGKKKSWTIGVLGIFEKWYSNNTFLLRHEKFIIHSIYEYLQWFFSYFMNIYNGGIEVFFLWWYQY
jgi:hypothetical protein